MAKSKAELEDDQRKYVVQMQAAQSALQQGDFNRAVELAVSSFPFIDGMMQFESRYRGVEFDSVDAIDLVLAYAPLVLDSDSLSNLESLLKSQRRIEKNTKINLNDRLGDARGLLRDSHAIWDLFERSNGMLTSDAWRSVPCQSDRWWGVIKAWCSIGLLDAIDDGRSFRCATLMDAHSHGKCSSCGALVKAPKYRLLDDAVCPSCRGKVAFVLVAERQ